jgi:hypothetical protein
MIDCDAPRLVLLTNNINTHATWHMWTTLPSWSRSSWISRLWLRENVI